MMKISQLYRILPRWSNTHHLGLMSFWCYSIASLAFLLSGSSSTNVLNLVNWRVLFNARLSFSARSLTNFWNSSSVESLSASSMYSSRSVKTLLGSSSNSRYNLSVPVSTYFVLIDCSKLLSFFDRSIPGCLRLPLSNFVFIRRISFSLWTLSPCVCTLSFLSSFFSR